MQISNSVETQLTEQELLPSLIHHYLSLGSAFALWRMPNSAEKHLLISDHQNLIDELSIEESETGFVFAPFDSTRKKVFFSGDLIYTFRDGELKEGNPPENLSFNKTQVPANSLLGKRDHSNTKATSTDHYVDLVKNSIDLIELGACEKIVPSRSKEVQLPDHFDCMKIFQRLCATYPNAFVSFVCSEETGTWLGATPELLVTLTNNAHFKTVALAGTKRLDAGMNIKSIAWTEKEIEEQALVCRYVISCFKKIRLREYEERGPRTVVAGNIVHLKTEFEVDTVATNFPLLASVMLKLLHPTSAVCGMPLETAQRFLKVSEGYDREFYAGFLGPLNFRNESHLFVNLRCLQLLGKTLLLYAGAGVTIDSDPEKEYAETELKMEALLTIINE